MNAYACSPDDMHIQIKDDALATYQFATEVARHYFCKRCGIYTFHQVLSRLGYYRVNLGCVEGIDSLTLPFDVFDGKAL